MQNKFFMKLGFYFINLLILFCFFIVLTIDIPVYFGRDWQFVGLKYLMMKNVIPSICFILSIISIVFIILFKKTVKISKNLEESAGDIQNVSYESLEFLMTYLLPLVLCKPNGIREFIVIVAILAIIGIIYARTNMFYKNPTLFLLGYKVYKATVGSAECILIPKGSLDTSKRIRKLLVDENIYYCEVC